MVELNINPGKAPDTPWTDTQYPFDGQWMPDVDAALIGPRNFASIINLRYNDRSIEGVNGYTLVNEDTDIHTTLVKIRAGHQFRTDKTQKSYMLVASTDDSNAGRVSIHTGTFGAKSDFVTTENFDVTGEPTVKVPYITDSAASLEPRFSNAPQNSVVYCNEQDTKIFSGYEHRLASAFMCTDRLGTNIVDVTEDMNNTLSTKTVTLAANLTVFVFNLLFTSSVTSTILVPVLSEHMNTEASLCS
jgi:hypothetical protein